MRPPPALPPTRPPFPGGRESGGRDDSSDRGPGLRWTARPLLQPGLTSGARPRTACGPLGPDLRMGPGGLAFIKTPFAHLATSSSPANARTWLPHPQNSQAIVPLLGNPPLPWLVTEGWARGGGFPLYILCHTNPQVLILAGFVFILIFFFFGFDFFNKNFHFKHIYTEGICAVYWGELDPELEWGGSWGRGNGSEGAPTLSMSPCPLSPPPQPLPPQFSL